ncbi:hypothetical protein [Streptomyces sp. 2R]|uniref:hypothetical protein n=1 Tax=Streptomyces sp. 2R TaxID=1883452 RepID=UPI0011813E59|nr:hypothetical protein [Streptomyces sp. 2R]
MTTSSRWINLGASQLPPAKLRTLANDAGLEARRTSDGSWRVCVQEDYRRSQSPLLRSERASAADPASFSRLTELFDTPIEVSSLTQAGHAKVRQQQTPTALAAQFQLEFMFTPGQQLADAMRAFLSERATLLDGPDSEIQVVLSDSALPRRAHFPRILTSLAFQKEDLPAIGGEVGKLFPAAQGLTQDVSIGALTFVLPALSAASPKVLGVPAARLLACGVWLFGQALSDADWPSNRLTDVLLPTARFNNSKGRATTPSVDITGPYLSWWVQRSAELLRIATDPAGFKDEQSFYAPTRHLAFIASLGRFYRDTAEAMRSNSHSVALRASYDALDCLEGMRWNAFDNATNPSKVRKVLARLRETLPSPVAEVALPLCERAARALEEVRDGFITRSRHYSTDGLVEMPGKGGPQNISWDKAVQMYIRLDRNSAHSFGKIEEDSLDRSLLFVHEGVIPGDLCYLPFLHLMDMLVNCERLQVQLSKRH